MDGAFNGHILVDKLAKLNSSQQSIETLSHWCIFHRKKAKQVVETWNKQFHCSRQEQRVPFLYLANDILQNSRRKGFEFVGEFWKVIPDALNDVLKNGEEFGRNVVLRLVDIWEERKVFGSRGRSLKEEIFGGSLENKHVVVTSCKMKQSFGDIVGKLTSGYENVYNGPVDEDVLLGKCGTTISCIEKLKETRSDLGSLNGPGSLEELRGQQNILSECIDQLIAAESSRVTLVSYLREAIYEQETKIGKIHNQLEVAKSQYEQVGTIFQQLRSCGNKEENLKAIDRGRDSNLSSQQAEEESIKIEAANVAAKLSASASSAEMLSSVLSSLTSIRRSEVEDCSSSEIKRPRLDDGRLRV